MTHWYMLTLIGKDQPGIVAGVTRVLFENSANLGEASMQRIGGYFTIMLMVSIEGNADDVTNIVKPVADDLGLSLHVDSFEGHLHQHMDADVCVSLYGADRVGIVATATEKLANAGLHILALNTDVGGDEEQPIFVMEIEGNATQGIEALQQSVADLKDLEIHVTSIDTMIA